MYRAPARLLLGHSLYVSGKLEAAASSFEEAINLNEKRLALIDTLALAQLSLIASDQGRHADTETLAPQALQLADEHCITEHP